MTKSSYLGDIHYGGKKMPWGKGAMADGTIYLSGADGTDPKTGECPRDVRIQTKLALEKVTQRLSEASSDTSHIVKMVSYVVGTENLEAFRAARQEWSGSGKAGQVPAYASTLIVVAGLARPEMLVEIDVIAVAK